MAAGAIYILFSFWRLLLCCLEHFHTYTDQEWVWDFIRGFKGFLSLFSDLLSVILSHTQLLGDWFLIPGLNTEVFAPWVVVASFLQLGLLWGKVVREREQVVEIPSLCFVYRDLFPQMVLPKKEDVFITILGPRVAAISCHCHHHCRCPPATGVQLAETHLLWGCAEGTNRKKTQGFPPPTYRGSFSKFSDLKESVSLGDLFVYIHYPFLSRVFSFSALEAEYGLYVNLIQKLGYNILIAKRIALLCFRLPWKEGRYPKVPLKISLPYSLWRWCSGTCL